jgi:hypothetical protein
VTFVLLGTAAAIAFGWWQLSLRLWPYKSTCWFCRGRGRMPGSKTEKHGPCPFCKGKPRLRRGAKG